MESCLELCVIDLWKSVSCQSFQPLHLPNIRHPLPLRSALYRLRYVWNSDAESESIVSDQSFGIRLDHVEMSDISSFYHSLRQLAVSFPVAEQSNAAMEVLERYAKLVEDNSQWRLLSSLSLETGGQGAERVHPLINEPQLTWHPNLADRTVIVSQLQDIKLSLHRLQQRSGSFTSKL